MNISFSVLSPPVIRHASHTPSPAPGEESHVALSLEPLHAAPTFPATHATGEQTPMPASYALSGTFDARVTVSGLGEPSSAWPLL